MLQQADLTGWVVVRITIVAGNASSIQTLRGRFGRRRPRRGGSKNEWSTLSLVAAVVLLLVADFLAFHDLFEPHTVRDWLMLAASALTAVGLAGTAGVKILGCGSWSG
ncbi:MAG TPA: hypothetical protein VGJ46_07265 [Candidatus Limnocylindrales bacterium]